MIIISVLVLWRNWQVILAYRENIKIAYPADMAQMYMILSF